MNNTITQKVAVKMILGAKKTITVTFLKRSTDYTHQRVMKCKIVKQEKKALYNAVQNHLITVWDEEKQDYRSIPTEGIVGLEINGMTFTVTMN